MLEVVQLKIRVSVSWFKLFGEYVVMKYKVRISKSNFFILQRIYPLFAAACIGGDSCCNENNKCDVGEGDCDYDSDCLEGLKCGSGNCPGSRSWLWGSEEWDSSDDCCYKPGKYIKFK